MHADECADRRGTIAPLDHRHERLGTRASSQLEAAEGALREPGMMHYAVAARYRRGQLLGGDEGRTLTTESNRFLADQTLLQVERIMNLLAPGAWQSA